MPVKFSERPSRGTIPDDGNHHKKLRVIAQTRHRSPHVSRGSGASHNSNLVRTRCSKCTQRYTSHLGLPEANIVQRMSGRTTIHDGADGDVDLPTPPPFDVPPSALLPFREHKTQESVAIAPPPGGGDTGTRGHHDVPWMRAWVRLDDLAALRPFSFRRTATHGTSRKRAH